ncbi:MAG: hypothetical protein KDA89_21570 [Planctomycetaceae bacterium]|nr:hypothetical protein [Planctomycetaceae bacterium]
MIPDHRHLLLLALLTTTGCALLVRDGDRLLKSGDSSLTPEQLRDFREEVPVKRLVRLNTSMVSALASDRRLRQLAWDELDESGLMSPEDRRRLNQAGIRIGVSGTSLPWVLSSLLRGDHTIDRDSDEYRPGSAALSGQTVAVGADVAIPEGNSSLIELPALDERLIVPPGHVPGLPNGGRLPNARCTIQVSVTEYGDGWVLMRFLPQLHHGTRTLRYSVSDTGDQLPVRQNIEPLYDQQFELKLHDGETVVIGHLHHDDWTVGRMLFQSESLSTRSERLIALRLEKVDEVTGTQTFSVQYRKY